MPENNPMKDLINNIIINNSHEDFVEYNFCVSAGFDHSHRLLVILTIAHYDYDSDSDEECITRKKETVATVTSDDAFRLSQRLHVPMINIPAELWERFGCKGSNVSVEEEDVQDTFKDILNFFLENKVRYKLSDR